MKILYACHQFFPDSYTGTERYTLEIAKQMQRMAHEVHILTYALTAERENRPRSSAVEVRNYEYEGVPVTAVRHVDFDSRGGIPGISFHVEDPSIFAAVVSILRSSRYDLVHCIHPMRVGEVISAAKEEGLRVVLTLMDYWMLCPRGTLLQVNKQLCRGPDGGRNCSMYCYDANMSEQLVARYHSVQQALRQADIVLAHSKFLIHLFRQSGVDTSRFVYLRNGMDYGKLKRPTNYRRSLRNGTLITFGFLGTVLPHKGVHVLVKAFSKVTSDRIRLSIYGSAFGMQDYYSYLLKIAKRDPRIEFRGDYDFNDVAEIFETIDVVVVPSVWYENAPLVISTAQMFGIPVITTEIGGMAEMVKDGRNGLTFRFGDVDELARKIQLVANAPEILEELSRNKIVPPRIETEAFSLESLYVTLLTDAHTVEFSVASVDAIENGMDHAPVSEQSGQ